MEAAHDHLDAGIEEGPADIDRAGELVRLHADETDHGAVRGFQPLEQLLEADDRIGLVDHIDLDVDVVADDLPRAAVVDQAIDRCEGIRGYGGAEPLDDVAVIVVVRRLYQNDEKSLGARHFPPKARRYQPGNMTAP